MLPAVKAFAYRIRQHLPDSLSCTLLSLSLLAFILNKALEVLDERLALWRASLPAVLIQ
jgi:hypothetical protein